ncbi:MAG TPA: GGDEF domain-containing protein [Candidatus Aquicultoraceae bacterium]|nr:GGDEF domain-containing protein [Candidatus Aquicultoraceae bacterium]
MPLPFPHPAARRAARRYFLPAVALIHLCLFPLFRSGAAAGRSDSWTASAFLLAGVLLFRDLATSRREMHLPDIPALTAWGAAALLELHAGHPAIAQSRIVPAAVFPAVSFLLPALPAAVYAGVSMAWMSWSPGEGVAGYGTIGSIAALAGLGVIAARMARRRWISGRPGGMPPPGNPTGEASFALLSREGNDGTDSDPGATGSGADDPLADREMELREGIRRILEGILPISGSDRILFVAPSRDRGSPFVIQGAAPPPAGDDRLPWTIPSDDVPLREAMIFRRAFLSEGDDAAQWGRRWDVRGERPSAIAVVPVLGSGSCEGAVLAVRCAEGKWAEPVVPLLEMGAYFIARETDRMRRRYREERSFERYLGFRRLARTIAEAAEKTAGGPGESASPRLQVYRTATEEILRQLGADRVLLVEADGGRMRGRPAWETVFPPGAVGDSRSPDEKWVGLSGTYAEWVLKNDVHRIFSQVRASSGKHPVLPKEWTRQNEDSFLLVPLEGAGGFRGILVCASRAARTFHKQDAETVREILAIMRMGISHSLHIETLEERASRDGLTGLLNQKTFRERLSSVLTRLDGRYPCAVIMIDLDHFKGLNDAHGHPAGDEVLRNVSKIIQKTIRKVDMAGRYGGEEFVLYLHEADREKAMQAAERLRLLVARTRFEFGGKEVRVTASLGVACCPSDGRESAEILARADEALYRSKQEGRNRATAYRPPA